MRRLPRRPCCFTLMWGGLARSCSGAGMTLSRRPYPLQVERPLVYFYGAASPSENPELYRSYVERLAAVLESQAEASLEVRHHEIVIN